MDKSHIEKVRDYILKGLQNLKDEKIFKINNMEDLGKYYYNSIFKEIPEATKEEADYVINNLFVRKSRDENEYFKLVELCGINYLPKNEFNFVKKEFKNIFIKTLNEERRTYEHQIAKIDLDIKNIDDAINKNEQQAKNAYKNIEEDFGIFVEKEQRLQREKNYLETQKEIIDFLHEDLLKKIKLFFKSNDIISDRSGMKILCKKDKKVLKINRKKVKEMLKAEALELSKQWKMSDIFKGYEEHEEDEYPYNPFKYYKMILENVLEIISEPEELEFVTINCVNELQVYKETYYSTAETGEFHKAGEVYKEKIKELMGKKELKELKNKSPLEYLKVLKEKIDNENILENILSILERSGIFRSRRKTIKEIIELYKEKKYYAFVAGLSSQIEGVFYDWLMDTNRYNNFKKMKIYSKEVLKEKIREILNLNEKIDLPIILYYYTYFNNLTRNISAHGKFENFIGEKVEIKANELIFDLYTLLFISEDWYNNEIKNMKQLIDVINNKTDENEKIEQLKHDLLGNITYMGFPDIYKVPPMQFAYWILNPYYNKIYEEIGYKEELNKVKKLFFNKKVWCKILGDIKEYRKYKYNIHEISREFINMVIKIKDVKGFDFETKKILTDIIKEGNMLLKST